MRLSYGLITIVLALALALPMLASCGNPNIMPETGNPPTFTPALPSIKASFILLVVVLPEETGSVTQTPYNFHYEAGTRVILTSVPADGYVFDHWSGAASGGSATVTIIMDATQGVTAHFIPESKGGKTG